MAGIKRLVSWGWKGAKIADTLYFVWTVVVPLAAAAVVFVIGWFLHQGWPILVVAPLAAGLLAYLGAGLTHQRTAPQPQQGAQPPLGQALKHLRRKPLLRVAEALQERTTKLEADLRILGPDPVVRYYMIRAMSENELGNHSLRAIQSIANQLARAYANSRTAVPVDARDVEGGRYYVALPDVGQSWNLPVTEEGIRLERLLRRLIDEAQNDKINKTGPTQ